MIIRINIYIEDINLNRFNKNTIYICNYNCKYTKQRYIYKNTRCFGRQICYKCKQRKIACNGLSPTRSDRMYRLRRKSLRMAQNEFLIFSPPHSLPYPMGDQRSVRRWALCRSETRNDSRAFWMLLRRTHSGRRPSCMKGSTASHCLARAVAKYQACIILT